MKRTLSHRTVLLTIVFAALALAGTACGSSSGSGGGSSSTPAAGGGGGGGTPINATEKDFSISLDQTGSIAPGTYTFHVSNDGPSAHDLTINGPGVSKKSTGLLIAGCCMDLTVSLTNGCFVVTVS